MLGNKNVRDRPNAKKIISHLFGSLFLVKHVNHGQSYYIFLVVNNQTGFGLLFCQYQQNNVAKRPRQTKRKTHVLGCSLSEHLSSAMGRTFLWWLVVC